MENSVSQLKMLVLDCKRSVQHLKGVSLDISAGVFGCVDPNERGCTALIGRALGVAFTAGKETPGYELVEKRAEAREKSRALDRFIHDLEVHLHERSYDDFARLLLEHTQRSTSNSKSSSEVVSEPQQQRVRGV